MQLGLIDELPYKKRMPFSNAIVHLCVSQRELLRNKQEARHLQAIKVNLLHYFHLCVHVKSHNKI